MPQQRQHHKASLILKLILKLVQFPLKSSPIFRSPIAKKLGFGIQNLETSSVQFVMSSAKGSGKGRGKEPDSVRSEKKMMRNVLDADPDLSRQNFLKALTKCAKECESTLKNEYSKFQAAYDKFSKEKAAHLQSSKDIFSKYEEEKEKLFLQYEQQRKKDKTALSELEKTCADKIANAEEILKKKKQCESTLKNEYSKFQAAYDKFSKEKAAHLQSSKDIFSKYEEEKEKLFLQYEQQRKKDKAALSELEKTCADKIANAEEILKKKKQCESTLKIEYSTFQASYDKFSKEKAAHLQSSKDIFSKYE